MFAIAAQQIRALQVLVHAHVAVDELLLFVHVSAVENVLVSGQCFVCGYEKGVFFGWGFEIVEDTSAPQSVYELREGGRAGVVDVGVFVQDDCDVAGAELSDGLVDDVYDAVADAAVSVYDCCSNRWVGHYFKCDSLNKRLNLY